MLQDLTLYPNQTTLAGVTTHLLYDGVDLVAEYDSTGTLLRRYVHGPGTDQPLVWYEGATTTAKNWLYSDHLGSVVATADSTGTSTATLSYGPYGEPNQTTGVRFRYTGQQLLGQLNLYYKARFYSPALGRFLQTDPIGYRDGLHLYAYVGNNPINWTDPNGLLKSTVQNWAAETYNLIDPPGSHYYHMATLIVMAVPRLGLLIFQILIPCRSMWTRQMVKLSYLAIIRSIIILMAQLGQIQRYKVISFIMGKS